MQLLPEEYASGLLCYYQGKETRFTPQGEEDYELSICEIEDELAGLKEKLPTEDWPRRLASQCIDRCGLYIRLIGAAIRRGDASRAAILAVHLGELFWAAQALCYWRSAVHHINKLEVARPAAARRAAKKRERRRRRDRRPWIDAFKSYRAEKPETPVLTIAKWIARDEAASLGEAAAAAFENPRRFRPIYDHILAWRRRRRARLAAAKNRP